MNRRIGVYGSLTNLLAVLGFALCLLLGGAMGAYLTSIGIALGFVAMACAFAQAAVQERKAAGYMAMVFAGIYATIIFLVYFAQLTAVRLDNLNEQAAQLLDYRRFGLFFSYDLLGYGFMGLATFFAGLTVQPQTKGDRWLKALLMIHGVFFLSGLVVPMLGMFNADTQGAAWTGTALLLFWCAYFTPVALLSARYFHRTR